MIDQNKQNLDVYEGFNRDGIQEQVTGWVCSCFWKILHLVQQFSVVGFYELNFPRWYSEASQAIGHSWYDVHLLVNDFHEYCRTDSIHAVATRPHETIYVVFLATEILASMVNL